MIYASPSSRHGREATAIQVKRSNKRSLKTNHAGTKDAVALGPREGSQLSSPEKGSHDTHVGVGRADSLMDPLVKYT